MPDLDEYKDLATDHHGMLVIWVDQSSDHRVLAGNLNGVCFALAREYVWAFREGGVRKFDFFMSFPGKGFNNSTIRVADKYVSLQQEYAATNKVYGDSIKTVLFDIQRKGDDLKPGLRKLYDNFLAGKRKAFYGDTYDKVVNIRLKSDLDKLLAPDRIFDGMEAALASHASLYFMVNIFRSGGAHAFAFCCRPDLSMPGFPDVYQFFDANLGLFQFPTFKDMKDFFESAWLFLYSSRNYSSVEIVSFLP